MGVLAQYILLNGELYLSGEWEPSQEVLKATVQSIMDSSQRTSQLQIWTRLPPTPHPIDSIAEYDQKVLATGGGLFRRTAISA